MLTTILRKIFGKVFAHASAPRPPEWMLGMWQARPPAHPTIQHWYWGGGGIGGAYTLICFNPVGCTGAAWQGRENANIFWAWLSSKRNFGVFTQSSVTSKPLVVAHWKNYGSFITCLYIYPPVFSSLTRQWTELRLIEFWLVFYWCIGKHNLGFHA